MTIAKYEPIAPYFGSKVSVAKLAWQYLGQVDTYIEPFFGVGGTFFRAEYPFKRAVLNDYNAFVANLFRAVKEDAGAVLEWADSPVDEVDMEARHRWLISQHGFVEKMRNDPHYYDSKIAGWWLWGLSAWIGSNWCSERSMEKGTIPLQRPHVTNWNGIHREFARGTAWEYLQFVQAKLRPAYMMCGDWSRCVTDAVFAKDKLIGIYLDPPYTAEAGRQNNIYGVDSLTVGHDVCRWAIENGDRPNLRIIVAGYQQEYTFPDNWRAVSWRAQGGLGNQGKTRKAGEENRDKEVFWISPHCVGSSLFDMAAD